MCGSFQQPGSIRILEQFERETGVPVQALAPAPPGENGPGLSRKYERERTLRPFNDVLVIYAGPGGGPVLWPMYWQLIHDWEKEFRSRYTCFNTRVESLGKRHNRPLLEHHRCILPVTGFNENLQRGGRTLTPRQVYEFSRPGRRLMALGGIYSVWKNPAEVRDRRPSCSIITVPPNSAVAPVHDRMPFILPPALVQKWLDPELSDFDQLLKMIRPYEGPLAGNLTPATH